MHTAVLRARPDIKATVHTHAMFATIMAMGDHTELRPITPPQCEFTPVRIVPFTMPGSDEVAEKVAKAMSRALVPTTPYVPRIVWALALYYLSSLREGVTDFFVSVCSKITDSSVRMLYVTLIDQLRYDNRITRDVTDILLTVFERCDDMHKELIIVELLRRMMCVTKPPSSVFELFQQIMARFKDQIVAIMKRNGELKTFEDALEVVTRSVYQLY